MEADEYVSDPHGLQRTRKLKPLKHCFPFRLGTTSYIVPAGLAMNVRVLAPIVDDIELVLFESDEISNLPDRSLIRELKSMAGAHDLSYTVHLPLDTCLGADDSVERRRSVEKCLRVFSITQPLLPRAYILHFHGDRRGMHPSHDLARWQDALGRSVDDLLRGGIPPHLLCIETLDYPFELVEGIVLDFHLSICLDLGHILLYGHSFETSLDRYFHRCRVIHLHGVCEGIDHRDISFIHSRQLCLLLDRLNTESTVERVLTLEVFSEADLDRSLMIMERFL